MPDGLVLQAGDTVVVLDGPFIDSTGPVRSIDCERGRVRIVVLVFGDETLIDIPLASVRKIT